MGKKEGQALPWTVIWWRWRESNYIFKHLLLIHFLSGDLQNAPNNGPYRRRRGSERRNCEIHDLRPDFLRRLLIALTTRPRTLP